VRIANSFISTKPTLPFADNEDEILLNKFSSSGGYDSGVYKVKKSVFLSTIPLVPAGAIMPFAGSVLPTGWLFCDGSIVNISDYTVLFAAIAYSFKDRSLLLQNGATTFGLPDFRGRFALGADNMGGSSANRVSDVNADTVGLASGVESRAIDVKNLPEHEHDLRSPKGAQFYVILDDSGAQQDADTIPYDAPTGSGAGQARTSSGGLLNRRNIVYNSNTGLEEFETFDITELGTPYNVMNPFLTVKYIIYTGVGG